MTDALIAIAVGYLLGSLPFGYWAGRLRGIDLRLAGSGNTGATNVMRVLGLKIGVPVMALDIGKGAAAVVIARALSTDDIVPVLAAAAAVTGHMYPLFLGFRGGKGVATGAGTMIALVPWIGIAAFFLWLGVSLATRYVSIGSVVTAVAYPAATIASGQPWAVCAYTIGAGAWVIWRHRANIARLRAGTENRINLRAVFAGRTYADRGREEPDHPALVLVGVLGERAGVPGVGHVPERGLRPDPVAEDAVERLLVPRRRCDQEHGYVDPPDGRAERLGLALAGEQGGDAHRHPRLRNRDGRLEPVRREALIAGG